MERSQRIGIACAAAVALLASGYAGSPAMADAGKALAVVKPAIACADLAKTDITDIAAYKGSGDVNDAANYQKVAALYTEPVVNWIGADFFKPYKPSID
jgi:hypothetical protein